MGLLSVTIDLDELDCYHAIHGLGSAPGSAENVVYERALPRAARFFEELGVPATLFAVGRDLARNEQAASTLADMVGRGHEVGNHTMNHRYDFTALGAADQAAEIDAASEAILRATGAPPRGFRAPGYNIHSGVTSILEARGYSYDSSVFPCPAYYGARAAAIGLKSLKGMRSASLVGDPRVLKAPTVPYRLGPDGVWTRGEGLKELPISVVTPARVPFIGTSLALMRAAPAVVLAHAAARLPFVNLELHGIDFADADGDGIGHLKEHQPDLRIPLTKRRDVFERVVKTILDTGLEPVTLADAASRLLV